MDRTQTQKKSRGKRIVMNLFIAFAVLFALFFFYTENYYRADRTAIMMLRSDGEVAVTSSENGCYFDGPGAEHLLIFYPGGKVQETAYAPLLRLLAEEGTDVFLVRMPFRLAVFGKDKAEEVMEETADHTHVYLGGHSLGGAMAADYAAEHPGELDGLILLASYSTKTIPSELPVLSVYGSEDGVLDADRYEKNRANLADLQELVIEGGNHAGFGSYGEQKGDGTASIDPGRQWEAAAQAILSFIQQADDKE